VGDNAFEGGGRGVNTVKTLTFEEGGVHDPYRAPPPSSHGGAAPVEGGGYGVKIYLYP